MFSHCVLVKNACQKRLINHLLPASCISMLVFLKTWLSIHVQVRGTFHSFAMALSAILMNVGLCFVGSLQLCKLLINMLFMMFDICAILRCAYSFLVQIIEFKVVRSSLKSLRLWLPSSICEAHCVAFLTAWVSLHSSTMSILSLHLMHRFSLPKLESN